MERISVNGKTYLGECIFKGKDFCIYVLDKIHDKYLLLHQKDEIVQDMIITGIDKIYEVIQIIKANMGEEELKRKINKEIENIKRQCYNKNLKMIDKPKLKEKITFFYDSNYPIFAFLRVKLPDLLESHLN